MSKTKQTFSLASAAMAFALSAPVMAAEMPAGSTGAAIGAGDKVHCYGVNSCKGTADCATADHACKGQNSCKGQGFKGISAGECLSTGGVIGDIKAS